MTKPLTSDTSDDEPCIAVGHSNVWAMAAEHDSQAASGDVPEVPLAIEDFYVGRVPIIEDEDVTEIIDISDDDRLALLNGPKWEDI